MLKTAKYKPAWTIRCLANQEVGKNLIVTIEGEWISTILKSVKKTVCKLTGLEQLIINHSVTVWLRVRKGPLQSQLVAPVVYYGNRARHLFHVVTGNKKGSTVHIQTDPILCFINTFFWCYMT